VQPSALLAETVLLHPVPAWSAPAQPRNDPPLNEPEPPDLARNNPRTIELGLLDGNAPRHENTPYHEWRHDEDSR
jgi:hypothetical protein